MQRNHKQRTGVCLALGRLVVCYAYIIVYVRCMGGNTQPTGCLHNGTSMCCCCAYEYTVITGQTAVVLVLHVNI